MPLSGSDFETKSLYQTAVSYSELGFSVIPVLADQSPLAPKIPAINWKPFQSYRADSALISRWFEHDHHRGLAIVTGVISNLIVLDFDDLECADQFANQFPELTRTRTIESARRKLPHYYFRLAAGQSVRSMRATGVDLLSDGRYVLAPPTTINGQGYTVVRGGLPRSLTNTEIQAILRFIESCQGTTVESVENAPNPPIPIIDTPAAAAVEIEQPRLTSTQQLLDLYRLLAPQIGRNEALFKTALRARDSGFSQNLTASVLVDAHAQQPPNGSHKPQSESSRIREGQATIASAFSRPPRPLSSPRQTVGLPNAAREAFLQDGKTAVARLFDGLFMAGFRSGDLVSERMMRESLKGQVGRHSILQSLAATFPDGSPVFPPLDPSPAPPSPADAASKFLAGSNKKCFLLGVTKPDKTPGGRPPKYYLIPHFNYICQKFDVENKGGDELTPDDITSVRKYRQGMQRELFKRRPGIYSRNWLANRLGVSLRTCQRYHQHVNVKVTPMYHARPITWNTLDHIPEGFSVNGTFLQDTSSNRYPPLRTIARQLLAERQTVSLVYQLWNDYRFSNCEAPQQKPLKSPENAANSGLDAKIVQDYMDGLKNAENRLESLTETQSKHADIPAALPPPVLHDVKKPEPYRIQSKRFYRQPLTDAKQETTALNLAAALNNLSKDPSHKLSQANARKWVHCYGASLILEGLGVVHNRRGIENPAGFLMVWLRSTAKERALQWLPSEKPEGKKHRKEASSGTPQTDDSRLNTVVT